jgi:hypothetical protein
MTINTIVDWKQKPLQVGTRVIFGGPSTTEEIARHTGVVTKITEPDADYDDNAGCGVLYSPKVTVRFDGGDIDEASTYDITRATGPDYPDEYTWQADDLEVA